MSSSVSTKGDLQRSEGQSFGWRIARRVLQLALIAAALFLIATSVVFVDETEYALVERFGRIVAVYDQPQDRGPHFKLPWPIDMVRRFDRRLQLFDPVEREIFTRDKKNVTIDTYICWKIAEPDDSSTEISDRPVVKFFRGLGTMDVAEARLDTRVRSILSTEIGRVELSNLLSVADSESGPEAANAGLLETVSNEVRSQTKQRPGEAEDLQSRLGVEIVDVRIKRLNLPSGNQQAVFERMKSERRKIADRYRSSGEAENKMIKSQADRQYSEILARAKADAERIRGAGEAEAISILNRAHSQDPEFYRVLQTLDTYRQILNDKTTLVLSASSNLLKLLTEGIPETKAVESPAAKAAPTGETPRAAAVEPIEAPRDDSEPTTPPKSAAADANAAGPPSGGAE